MNSFSEAVKLAVEKGGYEPYHTHYYMQFGADRAALAQKGKYQDIFRMGVGSHIFLDPKFWQSLSKALGWDEDDKSLMPSLSGTRPWWQRHARRFLDVKLSNGNEEQFFNELLKGK